MDYTGAIKHILTRLEKELPSHLHYHGHHHTIDVLEAAERIGRAEQLTDNELSLLLVATAYHDCGFLYGHVNHEEAGCKIALKSLPKFGFSKTAVSQIEAMIMATKVPQQPKDKLSFILCDADLDYLGRDDFEPVATSLFKELNQLGIVTNVEDWNRIQLKFLTQHFYHTNYGKTNRQPIKKSHLDQIRTIVDGYDG